jgi:hypothetical protein
VGEEPHVPCSGDQNHRNDPRTYWLPRGMGLIFPTAGVCCIHGSSYWLYNACSPVLIGNTRGFNMIKCGNYLWCCAISMKNLECVDAKGGLRRHGTQWCHRVAELRVHGVGSYQRPVAFLAAGKAERHGLAVRQRHIQQCGMAHSFRAYVLWQCEHDVEITPEH